MKFSLQVALGIICAGFVLYGSHYILNNTLGFSEAKKVELNKLRELQKNYSIKNAELQKIIEMQKLELAKQKTITSRLIFNKRKSTLTPTVIKNKTVAKRKNITKSVNYLNARDAITIHSLKCFDGGNGSGTIYKGIVTNNSSNGVYSAKLKVSFLYRKTRGKFRLWDSQNKYFKLSPMQSKKFEFESRIALDSFEMKCSLEATKKFVKAA